MIFVDAFIPFTVISPGSYETTGSNQRKIHLASSGAALTQPWVRARPKSLCQKVEWIAAPSFEKSAVQPIPGVSYPAPVVPPLIWVETIFRQTGICLLYTSPSPRD